MPIQQLPLMKGVGKDFRNADYIDYLPVNMLATPKEILNSSGYLRSFPGIAKRSDVNGISRGVEYNMAQSAVYRVCGGKLYKGESEVGDVAGSGRVSMAHGRTSQAVGVNGQLVEYRYDGTVKTVSNWPADSGFTQYELGAVRDITRLRGRYAWSKDGTDSWFITDLEDESHPDRYSAQYRAESQPDGIIGIGTWRDFIVCFGSSTIEYFSLTGATIVGAALYVAQPSLMVQKGIAGTYCKTPFADSYAFISNPATGAPSVYIIGSGQVSGQMNNYNNLANIGLGALQGQANAGQTYANNMSQISQQSAALAAANANRPSALQQGVSGAASGALLGGGIASALELSTPWGAGIGAGLGLLGSLF